MLRQAKYQYALLAHMVVQASNSNTVFGVQTQWQPLSSNLEQVWMQAPKRASRAGRMIEQVCIMSMQSVAASAVHCISTHRADATLRFGQQAACWCCLRVPVRWRLACRYW